MINKEILKKQIIYRSMHRGSKEMDLLLGSFVKKHINKFDSKLKNVSLPKLNLIKNIKFSEVDVVFFALPSNVSQSIIKNNFGKSIFIDLSADFRFDNSINYKNTYKIKHQCPSFLKHFVYGLPEINFKIIQLTLRILYYDLLLVISSINNAI